VSLTPGRLFSPIGPLAAFFVTLAVGVAWMVAELGLTLASGRALVPAHLVERMFELLPWQLAVFAAIGLGVAVVNRIFRLTLAGAVWWALCCGSFAFLGEALLEGLLRKHGAGTALLGLLALTLALAVVSASVLAVGRRLGERAGRAARGFFAGTCVGFSVFFLLWMQHSIMFIRIWEPGLVGLWQFLTPTHFAMAAAAAALAWAVAALTPAGRAAAVAALVWLAPAAPSPRADASPARRPDVLVLLIDTLRFDHLGVNAGIEGLTPELDALAAESVRFTRGYSPGNFTKLAMPGILTSLPYRVVKTPLPDDATTLAEHLKRAGYSTYGISANPYVTDAFGYAQGFDRFLDPSTVNEFLVEGLLEAAGVALPGPSYRAQIVTSALYYAPAAAVRRRALEFFDDSPGPTFVYLQTMDPHGPYLPPHRYLPAEFEFGDFESYYAFDALKGRGLMAKPEYAPKLRNIRERYRGEVRFTDDEVGALVAGLRENGRWDETLVIVLSDHGEAFGEKDWAGHSGDNISSTLVHVPFLLKPPRSWGIAPRVETSAVSTYDVLPTVLSLLELPAAETAFGRDLGPLLRGEAPGEARTVVSFAYGPGVDLYSAVRWPWKLDVTLDRRSGERTERMLYDLRSDPGELTDVASAHPEVARELSVAVQAWREREDRAALADVGGELDPVVREQLRKLGYIDE